MKGIEDIGIIDKGLRQSVTQLEAGMVTQISTKLSLQVTLIPATQTQSCEVRGTRRGRKQTKTAAKSPWTV